MPASQLKRLKASLRDQGITGPQKSKKQKKTQNGANDKNTNQRVQRNAALQQIRESFNPFEFKAANTGRPEKFASASRENIGGKGGKYKEVLHRPGVSKSHGEEMRRATLLPELRRRNKVGGVIDRRIGEGDVDMTPEERAAMRFAREKERKRKGSSMFDLEGSDNEFSGGLTHGGKRIEELAADDFDEEVESESGSEDDDGELFRRKRRRDEDEEGDLDADEVPADPTNDQPERKKTKKEVMQELIAKSKFHKYERQKTKEDDDDIREQLDQDMNEVYALLKGTKRPAPVVKPAEPTANGNGPKMDPERQRLLNGMDRDQVDRDYDVRLKQLAQDTRAKPSERSKTAEEKAAAEAERLRILEEKRVRRMQGEEVSDDEQDKSAGKDAGPDEDIIDEAADFGFTSSNAPHKKDGPLVLDDEDEFALDEDLIASGSEAGLSDIDSASDSEDSSDEGDDEAAPPEDEEDEFITDILGADMITKGKAKGDVKNTSAPGLAYTYPCPRNHEELLKIVSDVPADQLITIVQRIRALYHPSLSASNKESMADFSTALVDHLAYMTEKKQPLAVIEQLIRHLHSLSRTYPSQIGNAFRKHLAAFHERGQPTTGDMMLLTAIGSIYPTSDHWHQVVTPATTLMTKWLSLNSPTPKSKPTEAVFRTGAFFVALSLKYQSYSKRYLPEAVRFTEHVLAMAQTDPKIDTNIHVENLVLMADLYHDKSAFVQVFSPFLPILKTLGLRKPHSHLTLLLSQSRMKTRPLELHHHRPLPIRTSVPKFEESFNPDKHYDPDKERSDAKKLKAEYKRERKGAVRELRKDANFIAREQLKEKRIRDEEYEKKYRRLVAEVQNEEGAASKEYEREKRKRQSKK